MSDKEIAKAFEEKGQDFFEKHKANEAEDQKKALRFPLNVLIQLKQKMKKKPTLMNKNFLWGRG
ncbi:Uncharacterised protein [Actinobacillus equuli]|nr:Uncharacterised protein [Actinobacillus equuli]